MTYNSGGIVVGARVCMCMEQNVAGSNLTLQLFFFQEADTLSKKRSRNHCIVELDV